MTLIFSGSMCTLSLSMMYNHKGYLLMKEGGLIDAGKQLVLL